MDKKVGLIGKKDAKVDVKLQKSFYLAGETAYMYVEIDNTECKDDCNLIIGHHMKVKHMMKNRKASETTKERTETFVGPAAG